MAQTRTFAIAALLLTVALAGCFGDDSLPTQYDVQASSGTAADGWAYDGTGLVSASASLSGNVDVSEDTGSLNLTFEAWNSSWTVTHASFSGQEEYKAGGIAQALTAHGDTGTASTALPAIDLDLATWGSAEVLRDGEPYAIGSGPGGAWTAHLMLSEDTVRGADGLIADGNATGPYDPSQPTDARVVEDDPQAIMELIAPSGMDSARPAENISEQVQVQSPTGSGGSVEIPTGPYASTTVTVNTSASQGAGMVQPQGGTIEISIVDANGTEIGSDSAQFTPDSPYSNTFSLGGAPGPATMTISGNGTYTANVAGQVVYNDLPFIVLTWDDYTLEPR